MQSDKLIGLPIIHIDLGKRCGNVQGLILDPNKRSVAGLVVTLPGWRQRGLLSIEYVYAIGEQAVTIIDDEVIKNAAEESELRTLWRRGLDLKGMSVLTVTGRGLGTVESYVFQLGGPIEGINIQKGSWRLKRNQSLIPGHLIRSFGEDAVIVAAEAELALQPENPAELSDAADKEIDEDVSNEEPTTSLVDRWKDRVSGWGRRSETMPDQSADPMEHDPQPTKSPRDIAPSDPVD